MYLLVSSSVLIFKDFSLMHNVFLEFPFVSDFIFKAINIADISISEILPVIIKSKIKLVSSVVRFLN